MASGKLTTLYEGVTSETSFHVEFSRIATDITVEVTGGQLISKNIYAQAADLKLTKGNKNIVIRGIPINESYVILTFPVSKEGETDKEENPLITSESMAIALSNHVRSYLSMRNTYDMDYRGNPELEVGDIIGLETRYTKEMDALVLVHELRFNGSLHGTVKVKGLITGRGDSPYLEPEEPIPDVPDDTNVLYQTPQQKEPLVYNGDEQSPTWLNYDPDKLEISGTTSGTNAGTYSATFTPKEGYEWSD